MAKNISFTIKFWRQNGPKDQGHFDTHEMHDIPDDTSFLEMLDILNEELINEGKEPFVFDHDCREGICGMCSLYINGTPHGKTEGGTDLNSELSLNNIEANIDPLTLSTLMIYCMKKLLISS